MEKLKKLIEQHGRWQPLDEYIQRIEAYLKSDFPISIENVKSLLESIAKERNSDTEQLINDAFIQLNKLETQYVVLTLELKESTEDKRIIYAMIANFQQRIDLLQGLLSQIEDVKQLKKQQHENYV